MFKVLTKAYGSYSSSLFASSSSNKMLAKRLLDHLNKTGIRDALTKLATVIKGWENAVMPALLPDIPGNIPKLVIWGSTTA